MEYVNGVDCPMTGGLSFWCPGNQPSAQLAWFQHADSYSQPVIKIKNLSRSKTQTCQVPGCRADLSQEKLYALKKRICSAHMQAPVIQCGDAFARYCFQCAKVEPLDNFDGHKRSCRKTLNKRKQRPVNMPPAPSAAAAPTSSQAMQLLGLQQQQQQQQWAAMMQMQQQPQQMQWVQTAAPQMQQQLEMQQSLSAAADMVRQVAGMVQATRAGIRAAPQATAAAAEAHQQRQFMQQQEYERQQQTLLQQQQVLATTGAAADAAPSPCTADSNTAADCNALPTADSATDAAEFDSFLATLLDADDADNATASGASGASNSNSGSPTSSVPCSVSPSAPGTSCSSAATAAAGSYLPAGSGSFLPLPTGCNPVFFKPLQLPTVARPCFEAPAAQYTAPMAPAAAGESSRGMAQGALPSCSSMDRLGSMESYGGPSTALVFSQSTAAGVAGTASIGMMTAPGRTLAPAGYPSLGGTVGRTSSSCSTGTAAGLGPVQLNERIQHLNAMLMQVQSSVMALTQSMRNTQGAGL